MLSPLVTIFGRQYPGLLNVLPDGHLEEDTKCGGSENYSSRSCGTYEFRFCGRENCNIFLDLLNISRQDANKGNLFVTPTTCTQPLTF